MRRPFLILAALAALPLAAATRYTIDIETTGPTARIAASTSSGRRSVT